MVVNYTFHIGCAAITDFDCVPIEQSTTTTTTAFCFFGHFAQKYHL